MPRKPTVKAAAAAAGARATKPAARGAAKPPAATGHIFGSHLSVAGGVQNAITAAVELGFDTVQVFVKNQRQWTAGPLKAEDVTAWHELRQRPGFGPIVAHASYLINLASADDTLAERSRAALADELRRCDQLAIAGLVLHPGAAGEAPRDAAIARVIESVNAVFATLPEGRTQLLLEATAGQGSTLGRTFAELGAMLRGVRAQERVGVCVDTCHIFAAGYDIRTPAGYATMVTECAGEVGLARVRCWHLNDSKGDLGSHLDRHEHIGHGRIGREGFVHLLRDGRFHGVPMILETPKEDDAQGRPWDAVNLKLLRTLAAG